MVTVCIPTLNRYDLAQKCVESAKAGTLKPDKILIIDNGGSCPIMGENIEVYRPGKNLGVAASWNYAIKNTEDYCIIVNDDIEFHANTIERMVKKTEEGHEFVWVFLGANGFSCFLIRHSLVDKIGYFDEDISPGYAYFEDNDYHRRMELAGIIEVGDPDVGVTHLGSATLKAFTPEQSREHNRRFGLAQMNYIKKWGGLPHKETFTIPYGGTK
jgi:GT2 family glycosyltransferase